MHPTTPLAKNHVAISRNLFNEASAATGSKTYKKAIQKIALVLGILYMAIAIYLMYTGASLFILLSETIFLGALLFWLVFMLPGTRRKSKYKAMSQDLTTTPERTTIFYADHLRVTANSGKETIIAYEDIQSWQETQHLYLLNCKGNVSILLDKQGFTLGDFQTVKDLLPPA